MRILRTIWEKVSKVFAKHEIGQELEGMSQWLDSHPEVIEWAAEDLGSKELKQTGRHGMSVETVLRAGIYQQYWQVSYKKLSFHLADSLSCRAFVRLDEELAPKKSSLQAAIRDRSDKTWERINRRLLKDAEKEIVPSARKVRIDSTVTQSIIQKPNDSFLLHDSIRVMGRLLDHSKSSWGFTKYHNHSKLRSQLARKIKYFKKASQKEPPYQKLISLAKESLKSLNKAKYDLTIACTTGPNSSAWCAEVSYYQLLIEGVINQTERRVFKNNWGQSNIKFFQRCLFNVLGVQSFSFGGSAKAKALFLVPKFHLFIPVAKLRKAVCSASLNEFPNRVWEL
jgi:IS5 family transposase